MKHNISYGTLDILFILAGFQIDRKFSRNQQSIRLQKYTLGKFHVPLILVFSFHYDSPRPEKFFWIFEIINIDVTLSPPLTGEESLI